MDNVTATTGEPARAPVLPEQPPAERGLGDVLRSLANDAQGLLRSEIALGRAEMNDKLQHVIMALIWVFSGMLVGFAGLVIVMLAGVAALALVIPAWAAFLVIGIILCVVAAPMALSGVRMLSVAKLVPTRTTHSLQADARVIKEHT